MVKHIDLRESKYFGLMIIKGIEMVDLDYGGEDISVKGSVQWSKCRKRMFFFRIRAAICKPKGSHIKVVEICTKSLAR